MDPVPTCRCCDGPAEVWFGTDEPRLVGACWHDARAVLALLEDEEIQRSQDRHPARFRLRVVE